MAFKNIQFKIQFLKVKTMVAIEIYFRNTITHTRSTRQMATPPSLPGQRPRSLCILSPHPCCTVGTQRCIKLSTTKKKKKERNTKVYEKSFQLIKHFKKACKLLAKKLPCHWSLWHDYKLVVMTNNCTFFKNLVYKWLIYPNICFWNENLVEVTVYSFIRTYNIEETGKIISLVMKTLRIFSFIFHIQHLLLFSC